MSRSFLQPTHQVSSVQLGTLRWPIRLCEDARDLYNYTNPQLQTELENAFHTIMEVLTGKREHLIVRRFIQTVKRGIISPKRTAGWHLHLGIPVLEGDSSLVNPLLEDLKRRLRRLPDGEHTAENIDSDALVYGPGLALFQLVILRMYLRRKPSDDDEIYRLVDRAVDWPPEDEDGDAEKPETADCAPEGDAAVGEYWANC